MEKALHIILDKVIEEDRKYIQYFTRFLLKEHAYILFLEAVSEQSERIRNNGYSIRIFDIINQITWLHTQNGYKFWEDMYFAFKDYLKKKNVKWL